VPAPFAKPVAGLTSITKKGALKQEIVASLWYHDSGNSTFGATLPDGSPLSAAAPVVVNVAGEEYDLYKASRSRYLHCAAAGYELLRFGRVIGADALHPDDSNLQAGHHVHFREIPCLLEDGTLVSGFVDLNADGVQVFSDADLPPWKQWWQVQDAADGDSRCSAAEIRRLLDADGDGKVTAAEATSKLGNPQVRSRLARLLVKAPTEWEKASIDKRWGWLKQDNPADYTPYLSDPMTPDNFAQLKAFLELLCFWEQVQAAGGPAANHWHFEPREFISHFRKCGWLTSHEMAQCFPRSLKYLQGTQFRVSTTRWSEASSRSANWALAFNRAARRYGVSQTKQRLGNLFAHVVPETGNLSLVKEIGGERARYAPYYGRGLIQLTFLELYQDYGSFRNFSSPSVPAAYAQLGWDPDILLARDNHQFNAENCADSACFYVAQHGQTLRHIDHGMEQADGITISKDVNGNVSEEKINGLDERLQATMFMKRYFTDDTRLRDAETLTFTWRRNSVQEPVLDAQGHPVMAGHPPRLKRAFLATQHVLPISLERQRP
jgi:predicted chitinase